MIEEAYCSYEVAKLLKEKGFNERLNTFYEWDPACDEEEDKEVIVSNSYHCNSSFYNPICCSAPTHQIAMRWLREIHKIIISVYPFDRDATSEEITSYTCDIATTKYSSKYGHLRGIWRTYEEVVEVALKDCLKNIIK